MTVTYSAFCAFKSRRYTALLPLPISRTPCLSKAVREPDPSLRQSVVEPLGAAVTSDGKKTEVWSRV